MSFGLGLSASEMRAPIIGPPTRDRISNGKDLAAALGWEGLDLASREVSRGGTSLDVARGFVGGQPAVLFGKVTAQNGFDPVDCAALYAYHATVDWGLVADETGLTVFNSHWVTDGDWFKLPRIGWEEAAAQIELFRGLSPRGLLDGTIDRIASQRRGPTTFLKSVDDELVERLDNWRDQALRYTRDITGADERLQTLYAQLFVLRTVEDRKMDAAVPTVRSVLDNIGNIDRLAWKVLLETARLRVGSDLFDADIADGIPEHVFSGVIRDLYHPRTLPGSQARYDFSWIEADVLGLAYEKYLATVLRPAAPPPQLDMFNSPERGIERFSVRKQSGTYYTPKFMRDYLATKCVDDFFKDPEKKDPPHVIDFACGSGSFLVAAVDQVLKHLKARRPGANWGRELIAGSFIAGVDIDPKAVTAARLNLWQRLVEEPDALPLPSLSDVIVAGDGLAAESWGRLNVKYDIVLGNPPFLATGKVLNREDLEARFETAKGRYDFSYLFIEQALNTLSEQGRMGMVVPNRIFKNKNGTSIRQQLVDRTNLDVLIDFGANQPFDASVYIGCIVASIRIPGADRPDHTRVIEVKSLDPNFLAGIMLDATARSEDISTNILRAYKARHPRSGLVWTLLSESEQRARIVIDDVSIPLDTIAAIPQGIKTGANDLFIFELESDDAGALCKAVNGLGDSTLIETELLEPVVYGSEVQRYQLISPARRILYPHRNNRPLQETLIQQRYPQAWAYLTRNRDLLAARGSLRRTGGRFFELIWPRDESWLRKPKLLIRDLAPRTAFALDQQGTTFIVGGTAVVPEHPEMLLPLLAYLNSSVVNALVKRTTPQFRGDFQKFEPQHIQGIPILDRIVQDSEFSERLAHLANSVIAARLQERESVAVEVEGIIDAIVSEAAQERGIAIES